MNPKVRDMEITVSFSDPKIDCRNGWNTINTEPKRSPINIHQNFHGKNMMFGERNKLIDVQDSKCSHEDKEFPKPATKQEEAGCQRKGNFLEVVSDCSAQETGDTRTFAQVTQNIQAKEIVNVINISQDPSKNAPIFSNIESEVKHFLDAVKNFKCGHLILVADHIEPNVNLQSIGLVPWTFIFDFDPKSRSKGLLSQVETVLKTNRSLHINTWQDKCCITDQSTHWVFLKGTNEQPDSKTEQEFAKWKRKTRSGLEHIVQQLKKFGQSYTDYYVVIFWPNDDNMALHIKHLIGELDEMDICNFVIVVDKQIKRHEGTDSVLKSLLRELPEENQPVIIDLHTDSICLAINSLFVQPLSDRKSKFSLPTHDSTPLDITDHQAQWLKEDLEVLYESSPYDYENSLEKLQKQSDDFYRGGIWPWHMWYETGAGHVDVERDLMKDVIESLRKCYIDVYKSGRVTICHAPGSGGTTLAQRILWDLRFLTPCAQVKLRTGSSDVASRITFLYEKTRRPLLLLLDGEDEQRVELLMRDLRELCCVILYVRRYTYPMDDKKNSHNRFWLKMFVSKEEATKIAYKYLQQCDKDSKKRAVKRLLEDVERKHLDHAIFEFGLATYRHEYKGIESYVKGFLHFEDISGSKLLPWQHSLAILSLVYYYGQMAMPCRFFSEMLGSVCLLKPDDFPLEMQALIVKDANDGRTNMVRISHYLVAKEVLEQVLSRPKPRGERSRELCVTAKRMLEPFATKFIKLAGLRAIEEPSNMMSKIMTRTFICRDNKAAGETDLAYTGRKRKATFAPILHDVGFQSPFTERFRILEELTKSFPREAQFQAHLGRLYSLCRPEDEKAAEACFEKALEICKEEINGLSPECMPHTMRLTLMYIYHMYGNMFSTRVSKYTGKYLGDKPRRVVPDERFEQITPVLFQMVRMACEYFTKCRDVTPEGLEDDYGFIGEITMRLMFCDFVYRRNTKGDIYDFINLYEDCEVAGFVEECISTIEGLILECLSVVDPDKIETELMNCQTWFTSLFRIDHPGKIICRTHDSIKSRRIHIAARKLLYEKKKMFGVLEEVTKTSDIQFIVKEYEKNFVDIHDNGIECPRQAIDLDYREWIFAIRHKLLCLEYSLEDVLKHVRQWHDKVKTPNSRFYLFILCSLLGFGSCDMAGNTQLLIQAKQIKEEMLKQAKYIARPKYPREWLGIGQGIRRLTPGTRFFGAIEGRDIKGNFDNDAVETKIGTIVGPNDKPASGYISLDLGEDNVVGVSVFYVPVRSDMKGPSFAGARVEFYLGFSMAHGYEAYNVRPIKTVKCKKCGRYNELHSTAQAVCACGKPIKKE